MYIYIHAVGVGSEKIKKGRARAGDETMKHGFAEVRMHILAHAHVGTGGMKFTYFEFGVRLLNLPPDL